MISELQVKDRSDVFCPVHATTLLRTEFLQEENTFAGFCDRCLVHHPLCNATLHMDRCVKLQDHVGFHLGTSGDEFVSISVSLSSSMGD